MKNRQENILNFIGSTLLIIIFLLIMSAFSDKSNGQTNTVQFELVSEIHSNSYIAIIEESIHLPVLQKNWISIPYLTNFSLFSRNLKIFSENRKTDQIIVFLQKTFLSIKPNQINRFIYTPSSIDSDELPILS